MSPSKQVHNLPCAVDVRWTNKRAWCRPGVQLTHYFSWSPSRLATGRTAERVNLGAMAALLNFQCVLTRATDPAAKLIPVPGQDAHAVKCRYCGVEVVITGTAAGYEHREDGRDHQWLAFRIPPPKE